MIIKIVPLDGSPNIHFEVVYLCTHMHPNDILKDIDLDLFISNDVGIKADVNDPFLFNYIYAN